MSLSDDIIALAERAKQLKNQISTEEATKMSLIIPFFQLLGYDVFNPAEFCPEFVADVGIKKGEKVDYAILTNGKPVILVEAKSVNTKLDKHSSQLFRYFSATNAKFAILTDGIIYKFYTDLVEKNKMDKEAFYEFNILNLSDDDLKEIQKYEKTNFNETKIFDNASILRYTSLIKQEIKNQFKNPSDDFIRFLLKDIYQGVKTQTIIDKFRPVLKKSLNDYLDETAKEKMTSIITESGYLSTKDNTQDKLTPTTEELDSYRFIQSLIQDVIDKDDITYKKTESYFVILYKNNTRKWILRLYRNNSQIIINFPADNQKYKITDIQELKNYRKNIQTVLNNYTPLNNVKYIYTRWGKYIYSEPYKVNLTRNFLSMQ